MTAGTPQKGSGYGAGKVILLGEHAVVYGRPALAAGLSAGMKAEILLTPGTAGTIRCAGWSLELPLSGPGPLPRAVRQVLKAVGEVGEDCSVELQTHLPPSAGLGSSAALCVAVARAAGQLLGRSLTDEQAAAAAFEGERCFHGNPSGVDNSVAAFGGMLWFQKPALRRRISFPVPLPLVIAHSGRSGQTSAEVAGVRERREKDPVRFERLFDEIASLAVSALGVIEAGRVAELGPLLSANHRCLQEIGVSSTELDEIVRISLGSGAAGAKLTGAGGGGCALALCPDNAEQVAAVLERDGFQAFVHILTPTL